MKSNANLTTVVDSLEKKALVVRERTSDDRRKVTVHLTGAGLTEDNCAVVFIDHQPKMTFGVSNIDRQLLVNNVETPAKGAKE